MTSLWTPDGERNPQGARETAPPTAPAEGAASAPPSEDLAALEAELLNTPTSDIVANHCYGLFQLAALYLGQSPPRLEEARLAIDAFAAIVEQLGPRLGGGAETLREGLSQLRLAFVEIARVAEPGEQSAS